MLLAPPPSTAIVGSAPRLLPHFLILCLKISLPSFPFLLLHNLPLPAPCRSISRIRNLSPSPPTIRPIMSVLDDVSATADNFFNTLQTYSVSHRDGIIAVLLLAAAIISFAGRTLLRPTIFLMGFAPTFLTVAAFGVALAEEQASSHTPRYVAIFKTVSITIAALFALLIGLLVVGLLFRVATFLLCAAFGAILVVVFNLFLLQPSISPNALLAWYTAMLLAGLLSGINSVYYPITAITLATAFDGAALAIFSLAHFLGHQPNLLNGVPNTTAEKWWSVCYASATVLLGIFGAITQTQATIVEPFSPRGRAVPTSSLSGTPEDARDEVLDATLVPQERLPFHKNLTSPATYATNQSAVPPYLLPPIDESARLYIPEPPQSPSYRGSTAPSPSQNDYGATEANDAQYSVMQGIGAPPLSSSDGLPSMRETHSSLRV